MVGEPGIGKSRLVHEFTRHQLPSGWLVLEGTSVSYGKATPYFPLTEMLRRYFQITAGNGPGKIQERVVNHVLELSNMLKDTIAPILSLLGALPEENHSPPSGEPDWLSKHQDVVEMVKRFGATDPQQRRRRIFDAVKRVLIRESQRQPLLIVFEDLHWIDSETQAFLDGFVESLPLSRILLLVDYRPEYSHGWSDRSFYSHLHVDPLNPSSAEELLQHLLGRNQDVLPLRQLLAERTVGNPFFAEESVRSLVEEGVLLGEKGAYQPSLKIDEIRIPSTVQNVVADRIDRLSIAEKHLLQTAAVIGVIVPLPLLRAVAGLPEDELQGQLAHLQAAEFLYESNLFPQLEYTFKHALTNEVAYGALLHERKTSLHAKIVSALEKSETDNLRDHIETLAHHAYQGEIWEKAASYSRGAGGKAMERLAYRAAVTYLDQALSSMEHLPRSRQIVEETINLRLDLRNALFPLEELERLIENLHTAESLAEALGDQRRLGRICGYLVHYYTLMGDRQKAKEVGRRGLGLANALGDFAILTELSYYLGRLYYYMGEYAQAIELHRRNIESLKGAMVQESFDMECPPSILSRVFLVMCFAETGEFSAAFEHGKDAYQITNEIDHAFGCVYVDAGVGIAYLRKGDLGAAMAVLERGLERCRVADIPVQFPLVASPLGLAYVLSGRIAEGVSLLEQAVGQTAPKRRSGQAFRVACLSEAYFHAARIEDALSQAKLALELSHEHQERGREAWILRLIGEIHARRDHSRTDQSEQHYRQALRQANELKMRPLIAHCHLGLGRLKAELDQGDQSRKHLSTAIDLYRSMGMSSGLRQAEDALAKTTDKL